MNFAKAEVANQVAHVAGHNDLWSFAAASPRGPHNGAQRGPVEMIEMSMRDQHVVNRGQVFDLDSGTAQALEHKQPARKVGIDHNVLAANLNEKSGVPNEGDPQFAMLRQHRFVSLSGTRGKRGVAHDAAKLASLAANGHV